MTRAIACSGLLIALTLGCTRPRPAEPPGAKLGAIPVEDGMRWLADDAARARAAGAGAPLVLAVGAGAPGDNLGGRAMVPAAACALFLARGTRSVEDLDLFVYGDDGSVLAEDETSNPTASAVICPPHPEHVYAFGRIAAGHGLFAVSEQLTRPADAERIAHVVGAAGDLHEEALAEGGWPALDEAVAEHRRQLGGVFRDVRRVAVPIDPRVATRVAATIEAHQCIDVLVLPAEDVAYIELTVLDGTGRILGRAPTDATVPAAVVCSETPGELTFELRARAGRGLAAVVTSIVDDPKSLDAPGTVTLSDPLASPDLEHARDALSKRLARAGYPVTSFEAQGASGVGRRVSVNVDLPEGCSRLDVLDGAPANGVDAWLWSQEGVLLAHDDGTTQATLFACAPGHGRVDVEALTRNGPFALEVRKAPGATKPLVERPLAAGRVLGRLSAAERISTPRDASVHPVSLSASAILSEEATVPVQHCLDVALGLGPGAEGSELRLVDADDGDEVSFVRGTYSALSSACALGRTAPLRIRIEMRVSAGATDALLGTHVRAESGAGSRAPLISAPPRASAEPADAR